MKCIHLYVSKGNEIRLRLALYDEAELFPAHLNRLQMENNDAFKTCAVSLIFGRLLKNGVGYATQYFRTRTHIMASASYSAFLSEENSIPCLISDTRWQQHCS